MEPKIRLKGFSGEWKETTLGKLSTNYKYGINAAAIPYDGRNKYLRITDIDENTRVFSQDNLTSPGTDLSCCNEYLLEDGDITVARTGASVGKSYIYHPTDGKVYFAGFLIRARLNENVDKDCVFYNTLTDKYAKYIRLVSQRSGQPGVNVEELKGYTFNLSCNKDEQKALGAYFQHLDSLIQSTTKKIESLKQVKAASLQSMFPQEGETVPRIRFGSHTLPWIKYKLKSIFEERHEVSTIKKDLPQLSFTIAEGIIRPEDRKSNQRDFLIKDKDNKRYLITRFGDIIYNPANVVFGAIHRNSLADGVVSPIYKIFTTNQDSKFMECVVRRQSFINKLSMKTEGTVTKLKTLKPEAFLDMTVYIPVDLEEQKMIGDYFTNLDSQITLQTQRLEKLKQIKSACLDNMFV